MPSQLALDLNHHRLRAVEIDGSARNPKVRAFVAVDAVLAPPPAEGEALAAHTWEEAARELFSRRRFVRDPAAIALASADCTFRDLELPFTGADQIDKVIKFEAESHLQLVDIDSVVVTYQLLDADGRGGARLLAMAVSKETINHVLHDLASVGVDPHFADLHLTALYTALKATGYLSPPDPQPDAPPGMADQGVSRIIIECDHDVTNVLVVRGETLVAARAIRLGITPRQEAAPAAPGAEADAGPTGGQAAAPAETSRHGDGDETLVVVDDMGAEEGAAKADRKSGEFFGRLRREVQRTLIKLGPASEKVESVLLLGPSAGDEGFRSKVEAALGLTVEVARPFDRIDHGLDAEALELANAEGVGALGVALRMLGAGGSRVDFRQEDVRYARRFDQLKVALSCCAIVALVLAFVLAIVRVKEWQVSSQELFNAVGAVLTEYAPHVDSDELSVKVKNRVVTPLQAALKARSDLEKRFKDISSELGRSGTIPKLPSGLDYLNTIVTSIDQQLARIGRLEIYQWDLDVGREIPTLKVRALVSDQAAVDALVDAIKKCPAVKSVDLPSTQGAKDGRTDVTNLEAKLVKDFDPRSASPGVKK